MTSFDTSYLGAHRWHIEERQGYDWTCVCGEHGRVVSAGSDRDHAIAHVMEAFGRHAYDKLMEAATTLVLRPLPHNRAMYLRLLTQAEQAQTTGDKDQGNILMHAANLRHHESQEALHEQYTSLRWTSWPEQTSEGRAVEVEGAGLHAYWLHVHPSQVLEGTWVWETWLVEPDGNNERKLSQGGSPTLQAAQESAWDTLVKHENDLADQEEEPF